MIFQPKTWFFIDTAMAVFNFAIFVSTGSIFSLALVALCGWCAWDAYKKWKNL